MSMSDNELARALFPKPRDVVSQGMGGAPIVTTAYGHAVSDSESGTVTVVLDGEAGGVDAEIDVPTGARILEGDQVMVTVSGTSPVDAVTAGWGDALGEQVESVTNYFWHDTQGAHVATVEGDATTGQNVLIDSNSLDIRSGSDVLASFDADGLHLYDDQGNEYAYFTGSVAKIGEDSAQIVMPYSLIESLPDEHDDHWVTWAVSQGWRLESHSSEIGSGNYADIFANSDRYSGAILNNESIVGMTATNAVVQADGLPPAMVTVSTSAGWQTPPNHEVVVGISGRDLALNGENTWRTFSIDDVIAILGASDYVIEEGGTSADHRYRKWKSGKLEQWVRHYTTTTINTAWGNLYRSASYTGEPWPVTFAEIYHCYTTVTADGGDMAFVGSASAASRIMADSYYLLRGASLTTAKGFMISSYGVGTWK